MASKDACQTATFGWPFALRGANPTGTRLLHRPRADAFAASMRRVVLFLLACAFAGSVAAQDPGTSSVAVFEHLSPLASSHEVARRTQTPTTFDRMSRYLHASGKTLEEQAIDIGSEEFDLYVPARKPVQGYGLLVWIPPNEEGQPVPRSWRRELDRRGLIYAAPKRAGNAQNLVERRIPLALHAAHNVMLKYPVDPERVYVGGFSGGGRAALRTAVAYPDLFRGGLLNAGSDELDGAQMTLPAGELMELLQARSRLVYVTGAQDLPNRRMDERSGASAERLCISNLHSIPMGRAGHAPPDARRFAKAMEAMESTPAGVSSAAACRERLQQQVMAGLSDVESLVEVGRLQEAGARLHELDQRWGGLAAPRSVSLARRIAAAVAVGEPDKPAEMP
jgi:dienelactone hydrolase